jgi:adenylate cyclase
MIVLIMLGIVIISIVSLYYNKRKDHSRLSQAYEDLESAQGQLKGAQAKIKQLLGQQISGAVAEALITDEQASQVARRFVCIMFLDIRDFTGFAEKLLPEEIINYQNKVFGFMIDAVNRNHGIVNQILGDGFMATFGAPTSRGNDCLNAYTAAREIMEMVKAKSETGDIPNTRVGIGLHAGHVVTGNVGTEERKQYSITGNTVIIAARLEQLNKELGSTLVISREVYDQLPLDMREPVEFEQVMVKGRSLPVEIAAFERA